MNEQSVNEIYFEYQGKVYNIAQAFVKEKHLAEDLSHEVLIKCYVNQAKFKGDCSLDTWIYRVAKNHCIDFLRKSHVKRVLPVEDVEQFVNGKVLPPEVKVIAQFNYEELRGKISLLPEKYKEVVTLYYFKNKSLKEIQSMLDIKLSTVKTRLLRAKHILKSMYLDEEYF